MVTNIGIFTLCLVFPHSNLIILLKTGFSARSSLNSCINSSLKLFSTKSIILSTLFHKDFSSSRLSKIISRFTISVKKSITFTTTSIFLNHFQSLIINKRSRYFTNFLFSRFPFSTTNNVSSSIKLIFIMISISLTIIIFIIF